MGLSLIKSQPSPSFILLIIRNIIIIMSLPVYLEPVRSLHDLLQLQSINQ